eukprot:evm.model.NODE_24436_length_9398_cov_34.268673.2
MAPIFVLMEMVFVVGGKKKLHKVNSEGGREGEREETKATKEYEKKKGGSVIKIPRNGKNDREECQA